MPPAWAPSLHRRPCRARCSMNGRARQRRVGTRDRRPALGQTRVPEQPTGAVDGRDGAREGLTAAEVVRHGAASVFAATVDDAGHSRRAPPLDADAARHITRRCVGAETGTGSRVGATIRHGRRRARGRCEHPDEEAPAHHTPPSTSPKQSGTTIYLERKHMRDDGSRGPVEAGLSGGGGSTTRAPAARAPFRRSSRSRSHSAR